MLLTYQEETKQPRRPTAGLLLEFSLEIDRYIALPIFSPIFKHFNVKINERRKNQIKEWTYFTLLFIYFITVNKYRFCISVIGYINVQVIGIGYKKINIGRSLVLSSAGKLIRYLHGSRAVQRPLEGQVFKV